MIKGCQAVVRSPPTTDSPFESPPLKFSTNSKFKHFNSFLLMENEQPMPPLFEHKMFVELKSINSIRHSSSAPNMHGISQAIGSSSSVKSSVGSGRPVQDRWGPTITASINFNPTINSNSSLGLSLFDKFDLLNVADQERQQNNRIAK